MEQYGLADDEVELEPDKGKQQSVFAKFKKPKADVTQNKFAYDEKDNDNNTDWEILE